MTEAGRGWVAVGAVGVGLLRLALSLPLSAPRVYADELGYLAAARAIAGDRHLEMGSATFYQPGVSLLGAPAFLVAGSPEASYRMFLVVNAVLGALAVVAVAAAVRRLLGAPRPLAAAAGVACGLVPGILLDTTVAWAETATMAAFSSFVAAGAALADRPSVLRAGLLGAAAGATYLAHPRGVTAVVAAAVVLAALLATRQVTALQAAAGAAVLAATVGAALALAAWLDPLMYLPRSRGAGERLDVLFDLARWPELARLLAGQLWYVAATTLGVALVGLWALGARVARPGPPALRLAAAAALLAMAGTATLSLAVTSNGRRPDHLVYGRYNEMWVALALAAGVVALAGARRSQRRRTLVVAAAVTATLTAVTALLHGDDLAGAFAGHNVLGLLWPARGAGGLDRVVLLGLGSATATLGLAVLAGGRRRVPALAAVGGAAAALALSIGTWAAHVLPTDQDQAALRRAAREVAALAGGAPVGYDARLRDARTLQGYQWHAPSLALVLFGQSDDHGPGPPPALPDQEWVLASGAWEQAADLGYVRVWVDPTGEKGLWRRSGGGRPTTSGQLPR